MKISSPTSKQVPHSFHSIHHHKLIFYGGCIMHQKFTQKELYELRNFIPINDLICELRIPFKVSEGYFRFLCPICKEFQTATKTETNLAKCFRCERNFNTIDLVLICQHLSFVEAVRFLQSFYSKIKQKLCRQVQLKEHLKYMTKAF